jgi:hypothetical protein
MKREDGILHTPLFLAFYLLATGVKSPNKAMDTNEINNRQTNTVPTIMPATPAINLHGAKTIAKVFFFIFPSSCLKNILILTS